MNLPKCLQDFATDQAILQFRGIFFAINDYRVYYHVPREAWPKFWNRDVFEEDNLDWCLEFEHEEQFVNDFLSWLWEEKAVALGLPPVTPGAYEEKIVAPVPRPNLKRLKEIIQFIAKNHELWECSNTGVLCNEALAILEGV